MTSEDFSRDDLIPSLGTGSVLSIVLIALFLWLSTIRGRNRFPNPIWWIVGAAFAAIALWASFQLAGKFVSLATSWPLTVIAAMGGVAIECITGLYRFEKGLVSVSRGRLLLFLRLSALIVLIFILVQPIRSFIDSREIDREIAILIDQSDSMLLADQRLNATERLDRASLIGVNEVSLRPPFNLIGKLIDRIDNELAEEEAAFKTAPSPRANLESRSQKITVILDRLIEANSQLTKQLLESRDTPFPDETASRIDNYLKRSRDGLSRILSQAQKAIETNNPDAVMKQIGVARSELAAITTTFDLTTLQVDQFFYGELPQEAKIRIDNAALATRLDLAERVLQAPLQQKTQEGLVSDSTLLAELAADYSLKFFRFAQEVNQFTDLSDDNLRSVTINSDPSRSQTNLASALEHVLENTSPESLAGVLLLSDGRNNGTELPEDSLRQLAVQNTPLSAVPLGSILGPVDLSVLSLKAPESIYLDDRVVVGAEIKADGLLGKTIEANLINDGEVVDTQQLEIADVSFRTELRFTHRPEKKGISDYHIRLTPDSDELFTDNNNWKFKVAVTDDRTNVLLIDGVPRWEFRYLRNLFYGRDKSVHLQYVLLSPDEISRAEEVETISASASRPFGQAEATALPRSPTEWQLFDVIILGDIAPESLTARDWKAINEAVTLRGALLVCVSGARYMPHQHTSEILRNLLPVSYTPGKVSESNAAGAPFHLELTDIGQSHPVTSQSSSRALNQDRWAGFQPMQWRFTANKIKSTAEVLAYARPIGTQRNSDVINPDGSPGSVETAIQQLANRKSLEKSNAVITSIRAGLGKVLLLHVDETWRFRYGVGDTYHHRFWGQVTRWGAGPNLRSGNEMIRLGTDRLSYTPGEPVNVTAKALDSERRPLTEAEIMLEIWKDDKKVNQRAMSYRENSSGLYEATIPDLSGEGEYELRLTGAAVDEAINQISDGPGKIATELLVVTNRNPVELAELTADRDFLNRATQMTGGHLAELDELDSIITSFGAPKETLTERRHVTLWDSWPMLLCFLGLLTTEWILRRRSGLV